MGLGWVLRWLEVLSSEARALLRQPWRWQQSGGGEWRGQEGGCSAIQDKESEVRWRACTSEVSSEPSQGSHVASKPYALSAIAAASTN